MISRVPLIPRLFNLGFLRRLGFLTNGSKCATISAAALIGFGVMFSSGCNRTPPPLLHADPVPADFNKALDTFKAEGTRGWSFTQTTETEKEKLVEHFDPSKQDSARWTILQKDGHAPTEKDKQEYADKLSRRGGGETAPDVVQQIDRKAATRVSDDAQKSVYSFRLKPGGKDDSSAIYMVATFTYDKATHTFEKVELSNIQAFSPMFAVKIQEAHTVIYYQLPTADRPTLLDHITLQIRGRALIIRSLDEDMTVSYSDYKYTGQRFATKIQPDAP
jgi:hypothetical protein